MVLCLWNLMGMNANQRLRYLKITRKDKSTLAELNFLPAKGTECLMKLSIACIGALIFGEFLLEIGLPTTDHVLVKAGLLALSASIAL
ncbi:Uncharacterized protein ALO64_03586, partial [Pseudomonas meliae]